MQRQVVSNGDSLSIESTAPVVTPAAAEKATKLTWRDRWDNIKTCAATGLGAGLAAAVFITPVVTLAGMFNALTGSGVVASPGGVFLAITAFGGLAGAFGGLVANKRKVMG